MNASVVRFMLTHCAVSRVKYSIRKRKEELADGGIAYAWFWAWMTMVTATAAWVYVQAAGVLWGVTLALANVAELEEKIVAEGRWKSF